MTKKKKKKYFNHPIHAWPNPQSGLRHFTMEQEQDKNGERSYYAAAHEAMVNNATADDAKITASLKNKFASREKRAEF